MCTAFPIPPKRAPLRTEYLHSRSRASIQGLTWGQLSRGSLAVCAHGSVRTRVHIPAPRAHLPPPPRVLTPRPPRASAPNGGLGRGPRERGAGPEEGARLPRGSPRRPRGGLQLPLPVTLWAPPAHRRAGATAPPAPPPALPAPLLHEAFDRAQKECAAISALPPPRPRPRRSRSRSRSRPAPRRRRRRGCPACPADPGLGARGARRRPALARCLTQ